MIEHKKNIYWRKVTQLSASFLLGVLVFTSCKKEVTTIGNDINPNGLNVIIVDTFTVKSTTVIVDSLPTDETSISMLGALNDPELGITDCGIVSQIRLSSESPNFGDVSLITVDSIVLSFVYAGNKYYGELSEMAFEVFEINEDLAIDNDYYANSTITTKNGNLVDPGQGSVLPNPYLDVAIEGDTVAPMLRINLDPSFGTELINNASEMNTNDNFISFFKGLLIKAVGANDLAPNKGSVLYFSLENALSNMVLYYNVAGDSKKFTFNINSSCARFNKIDFDQSGTPVELVLNDENAANEKFYMQASHMRPEISFPYIMDLNKDNNVIINKAELILPVQDYNDNPFTPSLGLFIGKENTNLITDFILDYYLQYTDIPYNSEDKTFSYIVTRELQQVINGNLESKNLRIYPTNFHGSGIERVVFSGQNASNKDKLKLEITYTKY